MAPRPDLRWGDIGGGVDQDGVVRPMSFEVLSELAAGWTVITEHIAADRGPSALLRMARSLFTHSWFDYEFMAVACFVGFQAMEASFRELYTEDDKPLRRLVRRAQDEAVLPPRIADVAHAGVELRNRFAHPATQAAFTIGMASSMLENTHRLVALVLGAADAQRQT